jgi:hypothetical protein
MIKLFENFGRTIAYHITDEKNLKKISSEGLKVNVPTDYGESGDIEGVYLFKTIEDFDTALGSWFGERIEEIEEETGDEFRESLLVVDITGLDLYDSVGFEWTCLENISPDRILEYIKYDDFSTSIYDRLRKQYN